MDIGGLIRAFILSPGPGGVVVLTVLFLACVIYFMLTRWILAGGARPSGSTTGGRTRGEAPGNDVEG